MLLIQIISGIILFLSSCLPLIAYSSILYSVIRGKWSLTRSLTWCLTRCLTLFIAIYHLSHLLHIVYSSIYVIRGKTVFILSLCHLLHIVIVYMCNTWQITCLYSDFLSYFNTLWYFTCFVCRLFHGLPLIAYKRYYIYAKSGKTTSILSPYYFIYIFMFIDTLPLIAYNR